MSEDIIWALDQRERCIACPSTPVANAVVLVLASDGTSARDAVAQWAREGFMAAGVAWAGHPNSVSDDDWLDLEDAVLGLRGLAQVVAIHGDDAVSELIRELGDRTDVVHVGWGESGPLQDALVAQSPA